MKSYYLIQWIDAHGTQIAGASTFQTCLSRAILHAGIIARRLNLPKGTGLVIDGLTIRKNTEGVSP